MNPIGTTNQVEDRRVELLTSACKADVFPLALIPRYDSSFRVTLLPFGILSNNPSVDYTGFEPVTLRTSSEYSPAELIVYVVGVCCAGYPTRPVGCSFLPPPLDVTFKTSYV
jgi:hypothetical protein